MTALAKINIIQRDLTPEEVEMTNRGFDILAEEEGLALENFEHLSFVAMKEEKFIGCASGKINKNGNTISGWFFLAELYVEKAYRSRGIGSDLLKSLEAKLKSSGVHHIWLWTSGEASLRFYHRHGYVPFSEFENWYSDGSSRIGMRKEL